MLLYSILGYVPRDIKIYEMAMTHSSLSGNQKLSCNERLEFLGDAVLSSVTADYLYSKFSREREGFLTRSRSNLVCRERLNELALQIGLDKYVNACGVAHQHNNYIYGNALEALVGAIYIDKGYKQCRRFLLDRVFSRLADIESVVKSDKNYKSRLLEWGQKKHIELLLKTPIKLQMRKDGVYFVSEVLVDGKVCGVGDGFSKRESQQKAARQALPKLKNS